MLKKSANVKDGDWLDLIGEKDNKLDKRPIKRVILHKIVNPGKYDKPLVILVTWKGGLYEQDTFKKY